MTHHPAYHLLTAFFLPAEASLSRLRTVFLILLVAGFCMATDAVQAQVRFSLELMEESAVLEAESFDFNREARRSLTRDAQGRLTGVESAACLRISAAENIPVLVEVQFQDVQLRGGIRPVSTEALYLNDGGACPEEPAIGRAIGQPLDAQGRAAFTLDKRERIARNLPGSPDRLHAWIFLIADLRLNPDASPLQRAFTDQYEGEFVIRVEYL
ncbi:hypothetical protein CYPRO_1120 [Cyclonatronum proteinivorum]|uniref:Uncharacterized protein n=1 Tax=Cyclonatronum proteinivorum TaxID=1457365 RepID=A0A345UIT3_9BACT|nr:hypothetical protein [Cyclonatronum proteinivorum]AXJ00385.1 hypothetical protein CYPRO_1120 [Cyclonatronum proteinivorum]